MAARIPVQRAIGGDHPVTRNDDRDRIHAIRLAHGPNRGGRTDPLGEFGVADRDAARNLSKFVPDTQLEWCAAESDCYRERSSATCKILVQLLLELRHVRNGIGTYRLDRNPGRMACTRPECQTSDTLRSRECPDRSKRCFQDSTQGGG